MNRAHTKTPFFIAAAGCVALLSGCASLNSVTAEFDQEWNDPSVQVTPKSTAMTPVVDAAYKAEQVALLASLETDTDCTRIQRTGTEILGFDSQNPDAQLKLALCDLKARDLASARTRFTTLMAQDDTTAAVKGLGLTELLDGRPQKALPLLQRAREEGADADPQLINAIGYAEDQLGNWSAAESEYRLAADLDTSKGGALNNLGMSYLRQERYPDATDAFRAALAREPGLAVADLNLRIAYAIQGDYGLAFSGANDMERAAILNSVGTAKLANGENDSAAWMFQEALEANPTFYVNAFDNLQRARLATAR